MIDRRVCLAALFACFTHIVSAQSGDRRGVPDGVMVDPWLRVKDLIDFLPRTFASLVESERRAKLDQRLRSLDRSMGAVARRKLEISRRLMEPGFIHEAPLRSYELSQEVTKLIELLDSIYSDLSIREETTAKNTTVAMEALKSALFEKWRIEEDLRAALSTPDNSALQELSRKWRNSAERVSGARMALTRVRAQLNRAPSAPASTAA